MANPNSINPDYPGLASSGVNIATVAGGAKVIEFGLSRVGILVGSGVPTASAPKGSLYIRTDGAGVADRMYINTNGTTGWTNFTTAA